MKIRLSGLDIQFTELCFGHERKRTRGQPSIAKGKRRELTLPKYATDESSIGALELWKLQLLRELISKLLLHKKV